jgi:DNA replication and repair protein RecF
MPGVKKMSVNNVRSHSASTFTFSPTVNAVVGPNGSGKTSVLEAIYVLLRGSSFRGSVTEILQYGANTMRLKLTIDDTNLSTRSLAYQHTEQASLKKWDINGKKYAKLPIANRLPVVLFEPDLARLVTGSPDRRRQYLDNIAGQLDMEVAQAQSKFERALRQRNQLLKLRHPNIKPELFVWDTQLARLSETIVQARLSVIISLQKDISMYYKQLGGSDEVVLSYQSSVSNEPKQYASRLLQFLEASLQRDLAVGHTSFGPHRDDLEILLADQLANERASRGEVRSIVIACKLLEAEILAKYYQSRNQKPLLLLDDVLSELDLVHQDRVLGGFKDYQVILTTTDAHTLTPETHTIVL